MSGHVTTEVAGLTEASATRVTYVLPVTFEVHIPLVAVQVGGVRESSWTGEAGEDVEGGGLEDGEHIIIVEDGEHIIIVEDGEHIIIVEDGEHIIIVEDGEHIIIVEDGEHMIIVEDGEHIIIVEDGEHIIIVEDGEHIMIVEDGEHIIIVEDGEHIIIIEDGEHIIIVEDGEHIIIELLRDKRKSRCSLHNSTIWVGTGVPRGEIFKETLYLYAQWHLICAN